MASVDLVIGGLGDWVAGFCEVAIDLVISRRDFDCQLRTDQRPEASGERSFVEARRTRDAVAIEQRHRRVTEHGGALDDGFRRGGCA